MAPKGKEGLVLKMEAKAWQLHAAAGTHLENRIYVKRNERVPERCRELQKKEHRKCADKR